jgi:ABC-type branched-subunit amino acid transport system ATPase component
MTLLVTEQNIRGGLEIADNFLIIKEGAIIYQDTIKSIDKEEEMVRKYILD